MWLELLLLILGASVAYCFEVWLMVLLFSSVLQMIMIYWHVKGHSDVQSENEITVVNIRCSEAQMFENFDTSSKDIWRQSSSPGVSTPPHHSKLHSKCQTPPERQANKKTDTKDNQTKSQTVMSVVSVCFLCLSFFCLSFRWSLTFNWTHALSNAPPFNHRRSSFPALEHCAMERHVGVVTNCFNETPEDPSLQLFLFPNPGSARHCIRSFNIALLYIAYVSACIVFVWKIADLVSTRDIDITRAQTRVFACSRPSLPGGVWHIVSQVNASQGCKILTLRSVLQVCYLILQLRLGEKHIGGTVTWGRSENSNDVLRCWCETMYFGVR